MRGDRRLPSAGRGSLAAIDQAAGAASLPSRGCENAREGPTRFNRLDSVAALAFTFPNP